MKQTILSALFLILLTVSNAQALQDCVSVPGEYLLTAAKPQTDSEVKTIIASLGSCDVVENFAPLLPNLYLIRCSTALSTAIEEKAQKLMREGVIESLERNCIVSQSKKQRSEASLSSSKLSQAASSPTNDPLLSLQWGLHNDGSYGGVVGVDVSALEGWDIRKIADSVQVAVMDSGTAFTHFDLYSNVWVNPAETRNGLDDDGNGYVDDMVGWNAVFNDHIIYPKDDHGTMVAGIIGAAGNNGLGVSGVAQNVKLVSVQVFDKYFLNGAGTDAAIFTGLNYIYTQRIRGENLRVVNASLGAIGVCPVNLRSAIQSLGNIGILFVAASGNDGVNNDIVGRYPANCLASNVISVAAVDRRGALASFSNFGYTLVEVAAPGVQITSTASDCDNRCVFSGDGVCDDGGPGAWDSVCEYGQDCNDCGPRAENYKTEDGTSFAAPFVSGLAALLFAQNASLTAEEVRLLIMRTTKPLPALSGLVATGGIVSLQNALSSNTFDADGDGVNRDTDCALTDSTRWRNIAFADSDGDGARDTTSARVVSCFGATVPAGFVLPQAALDNCPAMANPAQTDSDGDGMGDVCDPEPYNRSTTDDADFDGVPLSQEYQDGTDPNDPGSRKIHLSSPSFGMWNSFLGMTNIFELFNSNALNSSTSVSATTSLHQIDGKLASAMGVPPRTAGQQFDVILNAMPGFVADSYGLARVDYAGPLAGRMSYYRANGSGGFDFAYSLPLLPPTYGDSAVTYNTYQPSTNPSDQNFLVANWHTLVNLAADSKSFNVSTYDQGGTPVEQRSVVLAAGARSDIDGGHRFGKSRVGLVKIVPDDAKAPYLSQLTRYGPNAASGFDFAFPLVSVAGNGRPQHVFISNRARAQNWVEVANTLSSAVSANVKFYGSDGSLRASRDLVFGPYSQSHFYASEFLNSEETGHVTITPSVKNALIAQSMFYFRNASGSIASMYGSQGTEAYGPQYTGTYNLYLGMENYLYIGNVTASPVQTKLRVFNASGSKEINLALAPNATTALNLHDNQVYATRPDSYGVFTLETSGTGTLFAELVRSKKEEFAFPTKVE